MVEVHFMQRLLQRICGSLPLIVVIAALLLTAQGIIPSVEAAQKTAKPLEKAFPHSEKCKRCHIRVFEEWEASAQSRSIISAPFHVSLERYVSSGKDKEGAMCFRCHAPSVIEYPDHAAM